VSVPSEWRTQAAVPTRTALLAERKREMKPDPSFDLDGDGEVRLSLFIATLSSWSDESFTIFILLSS